MVVGTLSLLGFQKILRYLIDMNLTTDCTLSFPDLFGVDGQSLDPASTPDDYRTRAKSIAQETEPLLLKGLLLKGPKTKWERDRGSAQKVVHRKVSVFLPPTIKLAMGLRVMMRSRYGEETGRLDDYEKAPGLMCGEVCLTICMEKEHGS